MHDAPPLQPTSGPPVPPHPPLPWSPQVRPLKANEDPLNAMQYYTIFITLLTVSLWCANGTLQQ